ncbi:MAG: hypothetical protein R2875_04285 [Desulfobacterales bacterium]
MLWHWCDPAEIRTPNGGCPRPILKCAATQRRLLAAVSLLLKPGGTMVYGVCSIEPEENEQVVEDFLSTHPHFEIRREFSSLPFDPRRFIAEDGYFRSFPHVHDMDGFLRFV